MLPLRDALGIPSTRVPINILTFVSYILPPFACSFAVAVLALMPRTRAMRLALWPIFALLALRAVTSVDMSLGIPELKFIQGFFVVVMFDFVARTLDWTLAEEPLVRHLRPINSTPSIVMDAVDLYINFRGHGWNWSRGLYIPRETRPKNRIAFVSYALLSAVVHAFVLSLSSLAILPFAGVEFLTKGLTAYDETLPFIARHLRAGILTALTGITGYSLMQTCYDTATVVGVLLFRQDPAQWPPAFDAPWCATSLVDFWGRRWHQWARRIFLFLGGYPLSIYLGRVGVILGAFLVSAAMHDVMLVGMDEQSDIRSMLLSFGMMAPGMLAERAFYKLTGRKVSGVAGWVWTMAWLLLCFGSMFDGYAKATMNGNIDTFFGLLPPRLQGLVECAVVGTDAWLRAL